MKIVLYSGGATALNHRVHEALADITPGRRGRRSMTYVPFTAVGGEIFFKRFCRRYERFGFRDFRYFAVDRPFTRQELAEALATDAIYLAGGNTFYFLHHLQQKRLLAPLRRFAGEGGVMVGLSAGAIILTPHIGLAGYPPFNRDANRIGLEDLRSLGLVPFEVFPHYQETPRLVRAISAYSSDTPRAIFGLAEGGGIVVDGDRFDVIGRTELFLGGSRATLRLR